MIWVLCKRCGKLLNFAEFDSKIGYKSEIVFKGKMALDKETK